MPPLKQDIIIETEFRNNAKNGMAGFRGDTEKTFGQKPGGLASLASLSTLKLAGVAGAVVGIGAALGSAVKTSADFEQSMAKVRAVTGANASESEKLSDAARKMGRETAFSADQAAEGMGFLGQAGFDTGEIIEALPATLELAAAGALDLGSAADIASNVLSGMRLNVSDLGIVVDGMAIAASNSNTSVAQLGQAMSFAAPGAAAAGVSFEAASAALGVLADNGIQATRGGTSFNAALRVMQTQSDENRIALAGLGVSFTTARGELRPLVDIIEELEKAQLSSADTLKFFGDEGGRAINALVGSGSERLKQLQGQIENSAGAAGKMADIQLNTLEGKFRLLDSAMSDVSITIGDIFKPAVEGAVTFAIIPAVTAIGDMISGVVSFAEEVVKTFTTTKEIKEFVEELKTVDEKADEMVAAAKETQEKGFFFGAKSEESVNEMGSILDGVKLKLPEISTAAGATATAVNDASGTMVTSLNLSKEEAVALDEALADVAEEETKIDGVSTAVAGIGTSADEAETKVEALSTDLTTMPDVVIEPDFPKLQTDFEDAGTDASDWFTAEFGKQLEDVTSEGTIADGLDLLFRGGSIRTAIEGGARAETDAYLTQFASMGDKQAVVATGLKAVLDGGDVTAAVGVSGAKLGAHFGAAMGGPIGAVVGGAIGSLAGKATSMIAGLFGKGKSDFAAAAVAEELQRSLREGGGVGTAKFSLKDVSVGGLRRAFEAQGLTEREASLVAGKVITGDRFGASGGNINTILFNAAVRSQQTATRRAEVSSGFSDRVSAAVASGASTDFFTGGRSTGTGDVSGGVFEQNGKAMRIVMGADGRPEFVAAASGFSGRVTRPTMFLAGEAGPEQVNIAPEQFAGGGSNGRVTELHFNWTVMANDSRGVREFIERDAREFIIDIVRQESNRGVGFVGNEGLIADPTV